MSPDPNTANKKAKSKATDLTFDEVEKQKAAMQDDEAPDNFLTQSFRSGLANPIQEEPPISTESTTEASDDFDPETDYLLPFKKSKRKKGNRIAKTKDEVDREKRLQAELTSFDQGAPGMDALKLGRETPDVLRKAFMEQINKKLGGYEVATPFDIENDLVKDAWDNSALKTRKFENAKGEEQDFTGSGYDKQIITGNEAGIITEQVVPRAPVGSDKFNPMGHDPGLGETIDAVGTALTNQKNRIFDSAAGQGFAKLFDPDFDKTVYKVLAPGIGKDGAPIMKEYVGTRAQLAQNNINAYNFYGLANKNTYFFDDMAKSFGNWALSKDDDLIGTAKAVQSIGRMVARPFSWAFGDNKDWQDKYEETWIDKAYRRTREDTQRSSLTLSENAMNTFSAGWIAAGIGSSIGSLIDFTVAGSTIKGAAGVGSLAFKMGGIGEAALLNVGRFGGTAAITGVAAFHAAKDAGLSDEEAGLYTIIAGGLSSAIESAGLFSNDAMRKWLLGGKHKDLAKDMVKLFAIEAEKKGGKAAAGAAIGAVTRESAEEVSKKLWPKMIESLGAVARGSGRFLGKIDPKVMAEEGVTEGLQSLSDQTVQVLFNNTVLKHREAGKGKFDDLNSIADIRIKEALGEAFIGALTSAGTSVFMHGGPSIGEYVKDGKSREMILGLDKLLQEGRLTKDQYDNHVQTIKFVEAKLNEKEDVYKSFSRHKLKNQFDREVTQLISEKVDAQTRVDKAKTARDAFMSKIGGENASKTISPQEQTQLDKLTNDLDSAQAIVDAKDSAIDNYKDTAYISNRTKEISDNNLKLQDLKKFNSEKSIGVNEPPANNLGVIMARDSVVNERGDGLKAAFRHDSEFQLGFDEYGKEKSDVDKAELKRKLTNDLISTKAYLHPTLNTDKNRAIMEELMGEKAKEFLPLSQKQQKEYHTVLQERNDYAERVMNAIPLAKQTNDIEAVAKEQGVKPVDLEYAILHADAGNPDTARRVVQESFEHDAPDSYKESRKKTLENEDLIRHAYNAQEDLESAFETPELSQPHLSKQRYQAGNKFFQAFHGLAHLVFNSRDYGITPAMWHSRSNSSLITSRLTKNENKILQTIAAATGRPIAMHVMDAPGMVDENDIPDRKGFFDEPNSLVVIMADMKRMEIDKKYRKEVFATVLHEYRHHMTNEAVGRMFTSWIKCKKNNVPLTPEAKQYQRLFDLSKLTYNLLIKDEKLHNEYFLNVAHGNIQGNTFNTFTGANESFTMVKEFLSEVQSSEVLQKAISTINLNDKGLRDSLNKIYNYDEIPKTGSHSLLKEVWTQLNKVFTSISRLFTPGERVLLKEAITLMNSIPLSKYAVNFDIPSAGEAQRAAENTMVSTPDHPTVTSDNPRRMDNFVENMKPVNLLSDMDVPSVAEVAETILMQYQKAITDPDTGRPLPELLEIASDINESDPNTPRNIFIREVQDSLDYWIQKNNYDKKSLKVVFFQGTNQFLVSWNTLTGSTERLFFNKDGSRAQINSNIFNDTEWNEVVNDDFYEAFGTNWLDNNASATRFLLNQFEKARGKGFKGRITLRQDPGYEHTLGDTSKTGNIYIMHLDEDSRAITPIGVLPALAAPAVTAALNAGAQVTCEVVEKASGLGHALWVKRDIIGGIQRVEHKDNIKTKEDIELMKANGFEFETGLFPTVHITFKSVEGTSLKEIKNLTRDQYTFHDNSVEIDTAETHFMTREELAMSRTPSMYDAFQVETHSFYDNGPTEVDDEVSAKIDFHEERMRRLLRYKAAWRADLSDEDIILFANDLLSKAIDDLQDQFPDVPALENFGFDTPQKLGEFHVSLIEEELKRVKFESNRKVSSGWNGESINPNSTTSELIKYDVERMMFFDENGKFGHMTYSDAKDILSLAATNIRSFAELTDNLRKMSKDKFNSRRRRNIAYSLYRNYTMERPAGDQELFEKAKNSYVSQLGGYIHHDAVAYSKDGDGTRVTTLGKGQDGKNEFDRVISKMMVRVEKIKAKYEERKAKFESTHKDQKYMSLYKYFEIYTGQLPYKDPTRTDMMPGINKIGSLKDTVNGNTLGIPGYIAPNGKQVKVLTDEEYNQAKELLAKFFDLLDIELPMSVLDRKLLNPDEISEANQVMLELYQQQLIKTRNEEWDKMMDAWDAVAESTKELPRTLDVTQRLSRVDADQIPVEFSTYMEAMNRSNKLITSSDLAPLLGDGLDAIGSFTMNDSQADAVFDKDNPKTIFSNTEQFHSTFYKGDGVYTIPGHGPVHIRHYKTAMASEFTKPQLEALAQYEGYENLDEMYNNGDEGTKAFFMGQEPKVMYRISPVLANAGVYNRSDVVALVPRLDGTMTMPATELKNAIDARVKFSTLKENERTAAADLNLAKYLEKIGYTESEPGIWELKSTVDLRESGLARPDKDQWLADEDAIIKQHVESKSKELAENVHLSGERPMYQYHMVEFNKSGKEFNPETKVDKYSPEFKSLPYIELYLQLAAYLTNGKTYENKVAVAGGIKAHFADGLPLDLKTREIKVAVEEEMKRRGDFETPDFYFDPTNTKIHAHKIKSYADTIYERLATDKKEILRYQNHEIWQNNIIIDHLNEYGTTARPKMVGGIFSKEDASNNTDYRTASNMEFLYMHASHFVGTSTSGEGKYYGHIGDVPSDKGRNLVYPLKRIPPKNYKGEIKRIQRVEAKRMELAEQAFTDALIEAPLVKGGQEVRVPVLDENGVQKISKRTNEPMTRLADSGVFLLRHHIDKDGKVVIDHKAFDKLAVNVDFIRATEGGVPESKGGRPLVFEGKEGDPRNGMPLYIKGNIFNTKNHFFAGQSEDQIHTELMKQATQAYAEYAAKGFQMPVASDWIEQNNPNKIIESQQRERDRLNDRLTYLYQERSIAALKGVDERANLANDILNAKETIKKYDDEIAPLKEEIEQREKNYAIDLEAKRLETFKNMMFNHLINRYHLSQLLQGDYIFYGNGIDDNFTSLSKRMAGTYAPAQMPVFEEGKHKGKMIALRDVTDNLSDQAILASVYYDEEEKKYKVDKEKSRSIPTNRTDAQGYISERFDPVFQAALGSLGGFRAPYKPVMFGHDDNGLERAMPIYLKLSLTKIPDPDTIAGSAFYVEYPQLEQFARKFYDAGADIAVFESGIKSGLKALNHWDDGDYRTQEIDLRMLGVQNNPSHELHEDDTIRDLIQMEKQMGDMDNYFGEGGLFEYWAIKSAILQTKTDNYFRNNLDDIDTLYTNLKEEMLKRDHTKGLGMALDNKMRLDNPRIATLMENMVASGLFINTASEKKLGSKLINMSDVGYTRPSYQVVDGKIVKAGNMELQWMGPRRATELSEKQLLDLLHRQEEGEQVFEDNDPSGYILDDKGTVKIYPADILVPKQDHYNIGDPLMAARIPGSGKNSVVASEIVGFLPADMNNVTVVGKAGPGVMGFDFDIDGFFVWRKSIDPKMNEANRMFDIFFDKMLEMKNYMEVTSPVSTDRLKELANFLDKNRQLVNEQKGIKPYDRFTLMRQIQLKDLNGEGSTSIGIVASAYGAHSVFSQLGMSLQDNYVEGNKFFQPHMFNRRGYLVDNTLKKAYATRSIGSNGEESMVFDAFVQLLNASTDNAKLQYLGRLGLNGQTMPVVLDMISHGVNMEYAILFVNQPIIQEYIDEEFRRRGAVTESDFTDTYLKVQQKYEKATRVYEPGYEYNPTNEKGETTNENAIYRVVKHPQMGLVTSLEDRNNVSYRELEEAYEPESTFASDATRAENLKRQLSILEKFKYYKSLQKVTGDGARLVKFASEYPTTMLDLADNIHRIEKILGNYDSEKERWVGQSLDMEKLIYGPDDKLFSGNVWHPYYRNQFNTLKKLLNWYGGREVNLYAHPMIMFNHKKMTEGKDLATQEKLMQGFYAYVLSADERLSPSILTGDKYTQPWQFVDEAAQLVSKLQAEYPNNYFLKYMKVEKPKTDFEGNTTGTYKIAFNRYQAITPELEVKIAKAWDELPEAYKYGEMTVNIKHMLLANLAHTKGFKYSGFSYGSLIPIEVMQEFDRHIQSFHDALEELRRSPHDREFHFFTPEEQQAYINMPEEARAMITNDDFEMPFQESIADVFREQDNINEEKVSKFALLTGIEESRIHELLNHEIELKKIVNLSDFKRQGYLNNPKLIPTIEQNSWNKAQGKDHTYGGGHRIDFDTRSNKHFYVKANNENFTLDQPMNFTDQDGNEYNSIAHAYASTCEGSFNAANYERFKDLNSFSEQPELWDIYKSLPVNKSKLNELTFEAYTQNRNGELLDTGNQQLVMRNDFHIDPEVLESVRSQLSKEDWVINGIEAGQGHRGGLKQNFDTAGNEVSISIMSNPKSFFIKGMLSQLERTEGIVKIIRRQQDGNKVVSRPVIYEVVDAHDVYVVGSGMQTEFTLNETAFKPVNGVLQYKREYGKSFTESLKKYVSESYKEADEAFLAPATRVDGFDDNYLEEGIVEDRDNIVGLKEQPNLLSIARRTLNELKAKGIDSKELLADWGKETKYAFPNMTKLLDYYMNGKDRALLLVAKKQVGWLTGTAPLMAYELGKLPVSMNIVRSKEEKQDMFRRSEIRPATDLSKYANATPGMNGYELMLDGARIGHVLMDGPLVKELNIRSEYQSGRLATKLINGVRKLNPGQSLRFDDVSEPAIMRIARKLGIQEETATSVALKPYIEKDPAVIEQEIEADHQATIARRVQENHDTQDKIDQCLNG